MEKEKIKPLLCVEEFINYFIPRAKKALKLKNKDFDTVHVDYFSCTNPATICVWFHRGLEAEVVGQVNFTPDGKRKEAI